MSLLRPLRICVSRIGFRHHRIFAAALNQRGGEKYELARGVNGLMNLLRAIEIMYIEAQT